MNKRQAKKQYKKTVKLIKTGRSKGISVTIINNGFIDKNGKLCDSEDKDARFITFKYPKIYRTKGILTELANTSRV